MARIKPLGEINMTTIIVVLVKFAVSLNVGIKSYQLINKKILKRATERAKV